MEKPVTTLPGPEHFHAPEDDEPPAPFTYLEDVTAKLQKHSCDKLREHVVEITIHNTLTAMRDAADNYYSHPDTPENLREELEEIATALDVILAYVERPSYAQYGVPYWPGWMGLQREVKP
jgi:hypothetical protein